MPPSKAEKYTVVRDTAEHEGHGWLFPASKACAGTVPGNLPTGDYTLLGHESRFVIERKGSVVEFVANLTQADKWRCFRDELERLECFELPFIVLEFSLADIARYPDGTNLPWAVRRRLRVTGPFYVKRLLEITLSYKTKIIPAGDQGRLWASSLFKRICERWPTPTAAT